MTADRGTTPDNLGRWVCATCGALFKAWATAERHVDQEHRGGGRIQVRVDPADRTHARARAGEATE